MAGRAEFEHLSVALGRATAFLDGLADRPVASPVDPDALRAALGELPDAGEDPAAVVTALADAVEPGLVASAGPRYFGFVTGGALPAAVAADWLTSAWDQNAAYEVMSPAAATVEEVALDWCRELLGLPAEVSAGLTTGAQMANTTALAAARHHVLAAVGWDVERRGLARSPSVCVIAGQTRHVTIDASLRMLGIGTDSLVTVDVDDQGRLVAADLDRALDRCQRPTIVCAQAGEVNTGSFDPFAEICEIADESAVWVHIDGAFGLWAAASDRRRHLAEGIAAADSWTVDGHKWLNVPYDSGLVFTAHPDAHRTAISLSAAYLDAGDRRDAIDWSPEASRRARGFCLYAALRSLGRGGVAELVDRCGDLAVRFAEALAALDGAEVVNDVVLNQVLVRFGDDDATRAVIDRVQAGGEAWMGATTWRGAAAMRISVSNWSTTEADVDRSVAAIAAALETTG